MEILNPVEACFDEDLLDFTLEGELVGEENDSNSKDSVSSFESKTTAFSHEMNVSSFSDIIEEELEWLSNKDSFPSVETFFGILSDNPQLVPTISVQNLNSSISTSSADEANVASIASCSVGLKVPIKFPARARSKRLRKRRLITTDELPTQQCLRITEGQVYNAKNGQESSQSILSLPPDFGRRCLHCQSDKTPQWRAGPMGPKTLCNACGVRYKSGRLLPEYRPANSPTFSSALHSNSHRKVVEMRKQKYVVGFGGGFYGER